MEKDAVLFLCTANSARSVMAEAFFRRAVRDEMEVSSAGLKPTPVKPLTLMQLSWPFDDPAAAAGTDYDRLAAFRSVRDQVERQVTSWVGKLRASGALSCVESNR